MRELSSMDVWHWYLYSSVTICRRILPTNWWIANLTIQIMNLINQVKALPKNFFMSYNDIMFSLYLQGIELKFFIKYFFGSLKNTVFIVILDSGSWIKKSISLAIRIINVKLNIKYLNILVLGSYY